MVPTATIYCYHLLFVIMIGYSIKFYQLAYHVDFALLLENCDRISNCSKGTIQGYMAQKEIMPENRTQKPYVVL